MDIPEWVKSLLGVCISLSSLATRRCFVQGTDLSSPGYSPLHITASSGLQDRGSNNKLSYATVIAEHTFTFDNISQIELYPEEKNERSHSSALRNI